MFPKRILVALETPQGTVYAPASGWDRFYLLWAFRNFRSLPQNVLSPRQQRLIGSLYRQASVGDSDQTDDAVVAGRVENFTPPELSTLPSPATERKRNAFRPRFGFDRNLALKFGTAALLLVIAILAWHQLGAQPVVYSDSNSNSDSKASATVPVAQPSEQPAAIAKLGTESLIPAVVEPTPNASVATSLDRTSTGPAANLQPVAPVEEQKPAAAETTARPSLPLVAASKSVVDGGANLGLAKRSPIGADTISRHAVQAHVTVVDSPGTFEAAADEPRMQISGRPRKLIYPVCPATEARGKVSLQAVVGYDGAVSRIKVLTGDRTLARAAVEAVRQWRYEPFSGAPQPIERETSITISFISNEVVAISFPSSAPLSR